MNDPFLLKQQATPARHLELEPERLRALGYAVVDEIVHHMQTVRGKPVNRTAPRAALEAELREPIPEEPTPPEAVLRQALDDVFGSLIYNDHPRFFAFVPGPSNMVSALAELLAVGYNAFAGTWLEGSGPSMIEVLVIDWLVELMGLPSGGGGILQSGGSMANLTALVAARHAKLGGPDARGTLYYSDQTHSSVDRAVRVLGFTADQVHKLPSDAEYKLDVAALRAAITADRAAGRVPFCVVANAGATNTGTIDPLEAIARVCADEGLWLHVDAAYGGALAISHQHRPLLRGIEHADSVTVDPHKWLFQPYEMGGLLVRQKHTLRDAFLLVPEYLADTARADADDEVNFYDYGVQLTRGFKAFKLWMSLKTFGLAAFREAVDWGVSLAEVAADEVRAQPRLRLVTPPQIGVLNFCYEPDVAMSAEACDTLHHRMVNALVASGWALVATTVLRGQTVVRLCLINPRTREDDVRATVRRLRELGDSLSAEV